VRRRTARLPRALARTLGVPIALAVGCGWWLVNTGWRPVALEPPQSTWSADQGTVNGPFPAITTQPATPATMATPATTAIGTTITGTVYSVADGDTFTLQTSAGAKVRVRILGIDAAEVAENGNPAQCGAVAAQTSMRNLLPDGTPVTVTTDPASDSTDRYGRTLGYASTATVPDLGLYQIEHGFAEAWVPTSAAHNSRYAQYKAAQATAQAAKTGAWATCPTIGRQP